MSEDKVTCNKCKTEKDKTDFYVHTKNWAYACKECLRKAGRDAYAAYRQRYPKKTKPAATEKVCKSCGQNKPIDSFATTKQHGKDYKRPDCKICAAANARDVRRILREAKPKKVQAATIVCECCQKEKDLDNYERAFNKTYEKYYYRKTCKICLKTNK